MGDGSLATGFEKCLLGLKEGVSGYLALSPESIFG